MKLRDAKVSSQLLTGFGIVIALLVIISAFAIFNIRGIFNNSKDALSENHMLEELLYKKVDHLEWLGTVYQSVSRGRQSDVQTDHTKCDLGKWYYGEGRKDLEHKHPELKAELASLEEPLINLHESVIKMNSILAANGQAGTEAALKVLEDETLPSLNSIKTGIDTMNSALRRGIEERESKMMSSINRTQIFVIIMGLAAIGIGVFFARTIIRGIMRQLGGEPKQVIDAATRIADGDLSVQVSADERYTGSALHAMSRMIESLRKLVADIVNASQNLSQAVSEISSGNQNLSQRTSEQASSLEEIASTIEEATATIKQNADNAQETNALANRAAEMADQGGGLAEEAVGSINDINDSSKKIGEIISVINEIAFQTNLLALNAAVEAARAGEQGRGFAVVAGEVRNLAQRSGNAAKEISELIKDSQSRVERGTELVNKSGEALREIIESIRKVSQMVSEIAAASDEQKQGIDQINTAVTEMDTMTQQNASLVEETASASEEMASQAQELLSMVQQFKLEEDGNGRGAFSADTGTGRTAGHMEHAGNGNGNGSETADRAEADKKHPPASRDFDLAREMSLEGFEEF